MIRDNDPIRICEWSSRKPDRPLTRQQKKGITEVIEDWQRTNDLSDTPLWFSDPEGNTINTRQYVGIIEIADAVIEIYPKLDGHLLDGDNNNINEKIAGSVMQNLLWILDVSGHMGITEIEQAGLMESPTNFYDIFALLTARHLLKELSLGIHHQYVVVNDNTRVVRGKVCISEQITRNMDRLDLISCKWDEFTPDIPLNRMLKCACSFLQSRVRDGNAFMALMNCITQLEDVSDIDPLTALNGVISHRWNRATERFRPVFDLAKRLLQGIGHILSSADTSAFVFLLDMNKVFEEYVKASLEAYFDIGIDCQERIGYLFTDISNGRIEQKTDYLWHKEGKPWIGDAKYKHLAKNQKNSLIFAQIKEDNGDSSTPAGKILNPNDVRQLTVYAEIYRKNRQPDEIPNIMLLYPFVGDGVFESDKAKAWNGSDFIVCPVLMEQDKLKGKLENALPFDMRDLLRGNQIEGVC